VSFSSRQASTPDRGSTAWLAIAGFLIGMAGIAAAITIGFLAMRGVLDVGGSCASGGPYVIATPCPDGTWLLPLAIFAGLGFAFLAAAGGSKVGGVYALAPGLAWVGLFCSFGFNFLQWGIAPPADPASDGGGGPGLIFILIGLMFEVMGIVPVITTILAMRSGAARPGLALAGSGLDSVDPWRTSASAGSGSMVTIDRSGSDLVAELERLTSLHQAGNLTDEEFAAAKRSLIEKGS